MFPSLPTCLRGGLVIGDTDEETQARVVTRNGQPYGAWVDDTTPNLEHWMGLAVEKYGPLDQTVFVCVPPGQPRLHHRPSPPIVNVYEWYPYGSGSPRAAWPKLPPKGYRAYIAQWAFPGVAPDARPLTRRQRLGVLAGITLRHPRYVFKF